MELSEVKKNLNKKVRYKDTKNGIDGLYEFTACTLRKNEKGCYYQAELIDPNGNCVIKAGLENISNDVDL